MIDVEVTISHKRRRAFYDIIRQEPGVYIGIPGCKGLAIRATQSLIDDLSKRFGPDISMKAIN